MNYDSDRDIHLKDTSDEQDHSRWCLIEVDEKGNQVGFEMIPWHWTATFDISDLIYHEAVEIGDLFDLESKDDSSGVSRINQRITSKLLPTQHQTGDFFENAVTYSMFGTARILKHMVLRLERNIGEDEPERCKLYGSLAYCSPDLVDGDRYEEDFVEFEVYLSPKNFDRIAKKIENGKLYNGIISVRNVPGFYSEWSPSIHTNHVKILGSQRVRELKTIRPPRLSTVGGFRLTFTHHLLSDAKSNEDQINVNPCDNVAQGADANPVPNGATIETALSNLERQLFALNSNTRLLLITTWLFIAVVILWVLFG